MPLFAGIDVGQSSTVAAVGDERGRVLGRGSAAAGDEVGQDASSTRLHDAITEALHGALLDATLPGDSRIDCIVAGISGYEGRIYGRMPQREGSHFVAVHDAHSAHAGAFDGGPGVLAIAGTGSAVYAGDGSTPGLLLGGWGYLFGDEGSAFALVRGALIDAAAHEDRGAAHGALAKHLLAFFDVPTARALARAFYSGQVSRAAFASFGREVLAFAAQGTDPNAVALVEQNAVALAVLAATAARRYGYVPAAFALVGGLAADAWFSERVDGAIADLELPLERVSPAFDAATGALLLACREAGARA